jgi:hypothetical protein
MGRGTVKEHPFKEGDRVAVDFNNCGHVEVRLGTVAQASSTQPHITWVDWDNGPKWKLTGTGHLRKITENGERQ